MEILDFCNDIRNTCVNILYIRDYVKYRIDNKELYDKCKYDTGQIKRFKISERHYLIWGSKYSFKIIN